MPHGVYAARGEGNRADVQVLVQVRVRVRVRVRAQPTPAFPAQGQRASLTELLPPPSACPSLFCAMLTLPCKLQAIQ